MLAPMLLTDKEIGKIERVFAPTGTPCMSCKGRGHMSAAGSYYPCRACNPDKITGREAVRFLLRHIKALTGIIGDQANDGKVHGEKLLWCLNSLQQLRDHVAANDGDWADELLEKIDKIMGDPMEE